jgi:hypothetical protein
MKFSISHGKMYPRITGRTHKILQDIYQKMENKTNEQHKQEDGI